MKNKYFCVLYPTRTATPTSFFINLQAKNGGWVRRHSEGIP